MVAACDCSWMLPPIPSSDPAVAPAIAAGKLVISNADGTDNMTVNADADGKFSLPVVAGEWNVSAASATVRVIGPLWVW